MTNTLKYGTLSVALLSFSMAHADDKNGNFSTDILSVGAAYVSGGATVFSEKSNLLSFNRPGAYDRKYSFEGMTFRVGAWRDIDISITGGYYSDYKETVAYTNAPVRTYNSLEGWGNPSVSVSYGILNDPANPLSFKLQMSASPNTSGNSTGAITPAIYLGYKVNKSSRVYSSLLYRYPTRDNYAQQEIVRAGFQYDILDNLTIDGMGRFLNIHSAGTARSYNVKELGVELIWKLSDRFYLLPYFINSWRSDVTSKDNNTTNKATSGIQTYSISLKYVF